MRVWKKRRDRRGSSTRCITCNVPLSFPSQFSSILCHFFVFLSLHFMFLLLRGLESVVGHIFVGIKKESTEDDDFVVRKHDDHSIPLSLHVDLLFISVATVYRFVGRSNAAAVEGKGKRHPTTSHLHSSLSPHMSSDIATAYRLNGPVLQQLLLQDPLLQSGHRLDFASLVFHLFRVDQRREGRSTNHNLEVVLLTQSVMKRWNEKLIERGETIVERRHQIRA
ncbi:hypothetical protein PFISCL1PPCAC_21807, partial [Pristionchus fissidentatus]